MFDRDKIKPLIPAVNPWVKLLEATIVSFAVGLAFVCAVWWITQ